MSKAPLNLVGPKHVVFAFDVNGVHHVARDGVVVPPLTAISDVPSNLWGFGFHVQDTAATQEVTMSGARGSAIKGDMK